MGDPGPDAAHDPPPTNRRKARKAANAERREQHRLAEERLAAERAQRRADNRAARERDAAARAEQQRLAEVARARVREQESERRQQSAASGAGGRPAPAGTPDEATQAAERERRRHAAAERRARRLERDRRRAEQRAERRREQEAARRAEREAVGTRARGTDPYAVLGIAPGTPAEEIDRAYRRLARAHHPDLHRHGTPQERAAHEIQMKRINTAYGILGDAQRRAAYDRLRRRP